MNTLVRYMSLVKFAHTVFAMPFALVGFVYAVVTTSGRIPWDVLIAVVLCMVFARNAAMGFNRWADRRIDAENPRTSGREIPAGVVSPRAAMVFVVTNALLFIITAAMINPLTGWLSPVALGIILVYSYCKRFTAAAHIILGLSLSIAPVGAYIAVTGEFALPPCILALLVMTWCAGFDIIYALQDVAYDRDHDLHSIPVRFGVRGALAVSSGLHVISVGALVGFAAYCPQTWLLWIGALVFVALLLLQHLLVTPSRQRNIGIAFGTLNGLASMALAIAFITNLILYS